MAVAAIMPAVAEQAIGTTDLALLASPDLSSPRATLDTFRTSVEQAYDILDDAYTEHRADPGFGTSPAVAAKVARADLLLRRAVATLDLSQVPAISRQRVGTETVLLLKEVLDRLPAVPPASVPDAAAVKADAITEWTFPYSQIQIVRLTGGEKAGQFVFSAASVARAPEFYETIRSYAERPDSKSDFFRFYTLTPGNLLPPKWYLWIEELPDWATKGDFLGQAPWQWVGLGLTILVFFGGYWVIWRLRRRVTLPAAPGRRLLARLPMPLIFIAVCALAEHVISDEINITGWPDLVTRIAFDGMAYLATAWIAYLLCVGVAEWIISSPRIDPTGVDASLIRVLARVVGIVAAVALIFYGATEIGLPLYGVIAGLGVGGLALGLAARPTLENLIGGLILYADRPVRVGDFCEFGNKMGVVEEIGIRSTRIRALDRTLITVPNAEFSNMQIINHTRRDKTMLRTTIGLRYETTIDQMRDVLERLRTALVEHPHVLADTVRVRFRELGSRSLGVEIRAYIDLPTHGELLAVQEELLFAIKRIIEESGTSIAPPPPPV